jgi:Outer membrane protein beta-barrel domain
MALLAMGGLAAGAAAQAQTRPNMTGPYAEVGYAWLTLSSSGTDVSTADWVARMGMDFMPYLGGEVFGGTSASSGDAYGASFKVDNMYGAYLKLHVETAQDFELFARAGWVHSTLKASYYGYGASSSDDSLSYGVGMQFTFADHWYMQGDYFSYYDKHGDTIKGPSLSVGYRF